MVIKAIKSVFYFFVKIISFIFPDESIDKSKKKWNKLATENARYYVVSKQGRNIDEAKFKTSGLDNYNEYIKNDEIINKQLGNFSDKNILNIGCGIGRLEEFMSPNFKNIYGIDISEEMIDQAKKRLKMFNNVNLIATSGVDFPFQNDFFDFIFSYIVFQHMPTKLIVEKNLREIYRTLKKDGIAKIQVRGGHEPYKWQWFYGPVYNENEIKNILEEIGFIVLKLDGAQTKRFWLWIKK